MELLDSTQEEVKYLQNRCRNREVTFLTNTLILRDHLISVDVSADPYETKRINANLKVEQLSDEVSTSIFRYYLGNKQPLIDAINATLLGFMDATAISAAVTGL